MKFDLSDFLQLDTKGLLAVNGGSPCGGTETHKGRNIAEVFSNYHNYEDIYFVKLQ